MKTSIEDFESWLKGPEKHNLEFKSARHSFDKKRELPEYCAAIANSGGGKLILGVDDKKIIIGSDAYRGSLHDLPHEIFQLINHHIEAEEIPHPAGRVIIFHIPSRPKGFPLSFKGRYLMRRGSSLVEMDQQTLRRIFNEVEPDFSSLPVRGVTIKDFDPEAVSIFINRLVATSRREEYKKVPFPELLRKAELCNKNDFTYASLILLGSNKALGKYLPDAEVILEWRQQAGSITHDARVNWRESALLVVDKIWTELSIRNLRIPFQEGFIQREILAFHDKTIREAALNAIIHRDYNERGRSIFIKANPNEFYIESPGGFPEGVTAENILNENTWRNRLLAVTCARLGLVERAGQGYDDMFRWSIEEGKGIPSVKEINGRTVTLKIPGRFADTDFKLFLERATKSTNISFTLPELLALEEIRKDRKTSDSILQQRFLNSGLIIRRGHGRGIFYQFSPELFGSQFAPTREGEEQIALNRSKQRANLLKEIKRLKQPTRSALSNVLELSPKQIDNLLQVLKREGHIVYKGKGRFGYWKPK